jgi:hypothetical protein
MIFPDYPGHLVAALLVLASAGLVLVIFRSRELRTPERNRYRRLLMALQNTAILSLLLILWNPSAWRTKPEFARNAVLALFDTSESMSVVDDKRLARLDKALAGFAACFEARGVTGPEYRIYGFDTHAYHCGSAELLRRWGSQSNLHEVFSLLADYTTREAPAGVVVFTDGQVEDKDPRRYLPLQTDDLPVLLVGVGSRRPSVDVAIQSFSAPASAWVDTTFTAAVTVAATTTMTSPVTVELLSDGNVVDSRQLGRAQFGSSGTGPQEATAEFQVPARQVGPQVLTARLAPCKGEVNLANNSRSTSVEVTQERHLQVLLYSQWANFDLGKIRQALAWDKRLHLDLRFDVIRQPGLADLATQVSGRVDLPETVEGFCKHDVIILGPCDLDELTRAQREGLYDFVAQRGGGLLLLPGRSVASPASWRDERAETMLPVLFGREPARLWPPHPGVINLTFEAEVGRVFEPNAFAEPKQSISPCYRNAEVKPASTVLATVGDVPIVTVHRLGRGRVCLLNASKPFMLYREDEQGGALSELVCGLVAYLGRTPVRGAGVELFVERAADDPRLVTFNAYVADKLFQPVAGANVLLTVGERTVSMEPTGRGYYRTTLDWGPAQSAVATVQAESNGSFLGERTVAVNLPPLRDEMSCVDLDEPFLQALARRTGARYLHLDQVDKKTAEVFVPKHQVGVTETVNSIWPKWPVFLVLCLLLSAGWFIRRATGLV